MSQRSRIGFVVESPLETQTLEGLVPSGKVRHYVETEERAAEEAAKVPGRTYRAVTFAEMNPLAAANLERVRLEREFARRR